MESIWGWKKDRQTLSQNVVSSQGSTLTFEPTCPIGQVTVKFYLSESENYLPKALLISNMHDWFQG